VVALFALTSALLSGCAGAPCGGADYGAANPAYAGTYSGTYHNERVVGDATPPEDLTLQVVVDDQGRVTGTATEQESGRTADVTGSISDWFRPCGESSTGVSLAFTFPSETPRNLDGGRRIGQAQPWPFNTAYARGGTPVGSGQLVLTKG
jgi:hypothetical protein